MNKYLKFKVTPKFLENSLHHYLLSTKIIIPGLTEENFKNVICKNTLISEYKNPGFIEIRKSFYKGHLVLSFRLNTWYPENNNLVYDKMKLVVEWDEENDEGLLISKNLNFEFHFDNDILLKMFKTINDEKTKFVDIIYV